MRSPRQRPRDQRRGAAALWPRTACAGGPVRVFPGRAEAGSFVLVSPGRIPSERGPLLVARKMRIVVEARSLRRARNGGIGGLRIVEVEDPPVKPFQCGLGNLLCGGCRPSQGVALFTREAAPRQVPVDELPRQALGNIGEATFPRDGCFQGKLWRIAGADVLALWDRSGLVV